MSDAAGRDYYTHESVAALWDAGWREMARRGKWFSHTSPGEASIELIYDNYHPYCCNICKQCPLTNTELLKCSKCKVMLYCCRSHQKIDWNRTHKHWCEAFCACRDLVPKPADVQSWRESSKLLLTLMLQRTELPNHTSLRQHGFMQPRCRKCFVAASDGATLISCPDCCGVALCESCHGAGNKDTAAFHVASQHGNPENECEQHFLSLVCLGMVVEQGCPLVIPSDTDCDEPFYPSDWHEYFERKRTDFASSLPVPMMRLAPVVAFITDGLSTPLTIQHAMHQMNQNIQNKLVIHVVGADINDVLGAARYLELARLNPQLKELRIFLIGPAMADWTGQDHPLEGPRLEGSLLSCREGVYHEVAPTLEPPSLIFCPHSGMHDSSYTTSWRPSIEYITRKHKTVPLILTGYTYDEVVQDTALLEDWGMRIVEPANPNPFRGLRPFSDPLREGADFYYINASYVVVRGT